VELRRLPDGPVLEDRGADDGATGPGEAPEPERTGRGPSSPWPGRLAGVALVAALVPLAVAAVRAIVTGWVPVGDSALIAVRSRDVLGGGPGGDVPLLGMWASASWAVGFDMNHPGPLLYDALAVPAALFGGGAGLVVGTALVGAASVVGIFVAARRVGGPVVAAAAMAVTALLSWSMGSDVLIEPWHAGTVLLPFLCFAVLAWAAISGDSLCLPWAVLAGSLVLATNLSYTLLVPPLLLGATVVVGASAWRHRGSGRRRDAVALAAAAVVALLCWIQPVIEQLSEDDGNLSRLQRSQTVTRATLGGDARIRAFAEVVGLPPWWLPPSYADDFRLSAFGNDLPRVVPSVLALVVVAALVGGALWSGRRDRDRTVVAAAAVAAVLLVAGTVTVDQTPTGDYGTMAYQLRWLWPLAAFVALALLVALVRRWRTPPSRAWWPAGAMAALTAMAAAANLPAANNGTAAPAAAYPVARELTDGVAAADLPGRVQVQCGEGVFDPYCEAVMAQLQDKGVGFVVADSIGLRQLGEGRKARGDEHRVVVVTGDMAVFTPDGARLITRHRGLSDDEELELFYLREGLKRAIAAGEVGLSAAGERAAARGDLLSVTDPGSGWVIDPEAAVGLRPWLYGTHRRDLVAMVHDGLVDADPRWREPLERYVTLQDRWDETTVAVFLEPPAA
jgi:hypothetical protein